MVKLTIGIPTYNSCSYLQEAIDKTLDQIGLFRDIELLICDNASDDGTQALVEEYAQRFPDIIKYIRHPSNLGMDRNFWSVIQHAQGEFVHWLADDDFYTPNGVKRILEKISAYPLDVVILSNNYLNTLNGKIIENQDAFADDILCERSGERFFLHENLKSLCLSNVVVNRSKCLEVTDIEKYFGCQWLHVALLTRIINLTSTAYIFNFKEPVVTVRIGNQKWLEKEGAIVFYYNVLLIFEGLRKAGYNKKVFEHIKTIFLPLILNGDRLNFNSTHLNVKFCLKFFRFYYDRPEQYILFCLRLLFKRHRLFFEGWEKIGT